MISKISRIVLALVLFAAAPIECRTLLDNDSKSGFVTFLEVKCTDSGPNRIRTIEGVDTQKKCVNECHQEKEEECNVATYDTKNKICVLFKKCGKTFEHKYIEGINDPATDVYDVEGFVTFGRVGENGYYVAPAGSFCKKATDEQVCDVIMNEEEDKPKKKFKVASFEKCVELCDSTVDCIQGTWTPDAKRNCRLLRDPGGASLFLSRQSNKVTFMKERATKLTGPRGVGLIAHLKNIKALRQEMKYQVEHTKRNVQDMTFTAVGHAQDSVTEARNRFASSNYFG